MLSPLYTHIRKILGKRGPPRKSHVLCQKCGSRMLIHTTYYHCPLCGKDVARSITERSKDSLPINNLVLRIKASVFSQDGCASEKFKSIDPPRELATEYGYLFFLGAYLILVNTVMWVIPPSLSLSVDDGGYLRPYMVFLLLLNSTILWNMATSSAASRYAVAVVSLLAGLALVVVISLALGGSADFDGLLGKALSLPIMQVVFLLWSFIYLVRVAELSKYE